MKAAVFASNYLKGGLKGNNFFHNLTLQLTLSGNGLPNELSQIITNITDSGIKEHLI